LATDNGKNLFQLTKNSFTRFLIVSMIKNNIKSNFKMPEKYFIDKSKEYDNKMKIF